MADTNPYAQFTTPAPASPPPAPNANPYAQFSAGAPSATPPTAGPPDNTDHPEIPIWMRDNPGLTPSAATAPSRDIPAATADQRATRLPEANLVDFLRYGTGLSFLGDGLPALFGDQAAARRANDTWARIRTTLTGANAQEGVGEAIEPTTRLADGTSPDIGQTIHAIVTDPEYRERWLRDERANFPTGVAFFLDQNEEHRAQIIRNNYPQAEFRRDRAGMLQFRHTPEGNWTYINRPGLSGNDAVDTSAVLEKFYPAARLGALPATLGGRVMTAGGASALTEYLSQETARPFGGPGASAGDVTMAGLGGAGGQALFDILSGVAPSVYSAVSRELFGGRPGAPARPLPDPVPAGGRATPRAEPTTPRAPDTTTRGTPEEIAALEDELAQVHARGPLGDVPADITDRFNIRNSIRRGEEQIRLSEGNQVAERASREAYAQRVTDLEARLAEARRPYFAQEPATARAPATPPPPPPVAPATRSEVREAFNEQGIPASRGQVNQDVRARQREDDLLQGGAPPALRFADEQAAAVERRAQEIATRGQPRLTENLDDAGNVLRADLQHQFQLIDDLADDTYGRAFSSLGKERVPSNASDRLDLQVQDRIINGGGDRGAPRIPTGFDPADLAEMPALKRTMTILRQLRERIEQGNAFFTDVERARQGLGRIGEGARGPDAEAAKLARHGFDEWLIEALESQQHMRIRSVEDVAEQAASNEARREAAALIQEARSIWGERQRLFSSARSGRDPGGATVEKLRDPATEITGTQVIRSIFGSGPQSVAQNVGALRRIIAASHETAPNGRLLPEGQTSPAAAAFADPRGTLTPTMQSLRESFWSQIMEPLRKRRAGTLVPARAVAERLDAALNGQSTAITRMLHARAEIEQMGRLLQVLKYIERPIGVNTSGTVFAARRMLGGAVDALASTLPRTVAFIPKLFGLLSGRGLDDIARSAEAGRRFSKPLLDVDLGRSPSGAAFPQVLRDRRSDRDSPDPNPQTPPVAAETDPMENVSGMRSAAAGTITFQKDGQWVTLPTILGGAQLGVTGAIQRWRDGQIAPVAVAQTEDEAVEAARRYRSNVPETVH